MAWPGVRAKQEGDTRERDERVTIREELGRINRKYEDLVKKL